MGASRLKSRRRQDLGSKWVRVAIAILSTVGVIDPVSITPTVENIAITTLAHLEPWSWRLRLFSLEDPMRVN